MSKRGQVQKGKNGGRKNKQSIGGGGTGAKNTGSYSMVQLAPVAGGYKLAKPKSPKVSYRPDGSCIVSHTEYVGDVTAGVNGVVGSYRINPQSNTTFTWLSALATRFELYRFNRFVVKYRPSCSTATTGWIIVGVDFDSYDAVPGKVEMLAWKLSAKSALWQEARLDLSREARLATYRYCDAATGPRGDLRMDDLGKLVVLAQTGTTSAVGELFVEYTVEFRQPSYKIPPALYANLKGHDMLSSSDWFGATKEKFAERVSQETNIGLEWISEQVLKILDTGAYLIESVVEASGSITNAIGITISCPADSPSSSAVWTPLNAVYTATAAITTGTLIVKTAPYLINFAGQSGNNMVNKVRFSTFKA